ncbi:alpha/beta hydrolase [Pyxidicoccus xibeiensis]|uniref:alpha/beta hydrolase n=1 Tax=Pyxidicoccus xibeiensis TaxID=2906759 RepID=UPI0020A821EB|nr:alpha/beta fold hydrolase [Pyxidicoccus xibeiensis]MCP3143945.1 alpha/beta hydrolase [Pyxidicoccus xibeiensis]
MATHRIPVVFIHGLWLHSDSWKPWVELFRAAGYEAFNPGWPGDASTVEETRQHPERVANLSVADITEHHVRFVRELGTKPILIGHSFGGLIAQKLLGMGLASAAVAIDPAQFRGVLPLPFIQLKTVFPVLGNPANYKRAVSQTPEQFHEGFANAVPEEESNALHAKYTIPTPARPLFEAAFANLNWKTAARVDTRNPDRGPLLIIGGGRDATVPESVSRAEYRRYRKAPTVTDYKVFSDRGHSLVIDHGWREIAETALEWLARQRLAPTATGEEHFLGLDPAAASPPPPVPRTP